MFFRVLEREKPDYLFVAFDLPTPTFRHLMYKEYKANREKSPDDFRSQVPYIKQFVKDIGVTLIEKEGFEADDVIGTIAELAKKENETINSYILTGDKDVLQLVGDNTFALLTKKGISDIVTCDESRVVLEMSIKPEQVVDYKALKGDSSDNIPGIAGIGDKTAIGLLAEFGSLDGIYKNIEAVSSKRVQEKLIEGKETAYLSRDLARINIAVPMEITFKHTALNYNKVRPLFNELEMQNLARKYLAHDIEKIVEAKTYSGTVIDKKEAFDMLVAKLKKSSVFAMYIKKMTDGNILGVSFSLGNKQSFYIPLHHNQGNYESYHNNLGPMFAPEKENIFLSMREFLEDDLIVKKVHDSKEITAILESNGVTIKNIQADTMLMDYLLHPDRSNHSIKNTVRDNKGEQIPELKDIMDVAKIKDVTELSAAQILPYMISRSESILTLSDDLSLKMREQKLDDVYTKIDFPIIKALTAIEKRGIKIDKNYLKELSTDYHKRALEMEKNVFILAGEEFNLNSPKQLGDILFNKLMLPTQKKTKTGFSTNIDALESLAPDYEIADMIISYRQVTKLLNTYIDVLPRLADSHDRIHSSFNVTVAATGRLSSSDPNLQNIPIRTEDGERIRKAFISEQGKILIVADYSQIELRVLSHICEDKKLIDAFKNNLDIHTATAAEVFGVSLTEVTSAMRRKAKEINFGLAYGMKAFGLAQRLKISRKEAEDHMAVYFEKYPMIKDYIEKTIELVSKNGYIETLFGRKRFFPNYNDVSKMEKNAIDRMVINMPIQGTAADIIKMAMLQLEKELIGKESKIILQVHDELVVEATQNELEDVKEIVKNVMEKIVVLKVPLTVNIGTGTDWLNAK